MLKPLILAAALAIGSSTIATATPISSSPMMISDDISVSRVKHLRDRAPVPPHRRHYTIALSMGLLVSLIAAAVVTD